MPPPPSLRLAALPSPSLPGPGPSARSRSPRPSAISHSAHGAAPLRPPRVPFASPSARQPGSPHRSLLLRLAAAAAHPPAPSSPEPGLPSPPFALSQSPARPRAPAARSPADSPVLIQSGLAMLAMAKISAARKRHPEMMVSLSISPPRPPTPRAPGRPRPHASRPMGRRRGQKTPRRRLAPLSPRAPLAPSARPGLAAAARPAQPEPPPAPELLRPPAPHPEAKPRRWRGRLRLSAPDDPVLSSRSSPGSQPQSFLPPASGLAPPGFFSAARLAALDWAGAAFIPAGGGLATAEGVGDRLLSPCIIVASAVSVSPGLPYLGNAAGTVGAGGAEVDKRNKFPALRKLTSWGGRGEEETETLLKTDL